MTDFLLCTLYAPLASWGDIAVGEVRGSSDRPSRSALLGLIGAALGLDRLDQDAHDALDRGYGVAVRLDAVGTSLADYHTAQTVASAALKGTRPGTRRALLASDEPQTILSRRGYRQDACATAAIWVREEARWPLAAIRDALRAPHFVPYAGRKANPFGLPLDPTIVEGTTLADVLQQQTRLRSTLGEMLPRLRWLPPGDREVAHDPCDGFSSGLEKRRRETRRDAAPQRERWQFSNRTVEIGVVRTGQVEGAT